MERTLNPRRICFLIGIACLMALVAFHQDASLPAVQGKEASHGPAENEALKQSGTLDKAQARAAPTYSESQASFHFRNTAAGIGYVGSVACASCHSTIAREHATTPHGQAMSLPGERPELRALPPDGVTICEKDSPYCFRVFRELSNYYVTEFEPGPNGTEMFADKQQIAYAMGKPMAGTGYIIRRGDYLFESPLSYYGGNQDTHPQGWGISPGYDKDPLGFTRPLVGSCMFCHVGRLQSTDDASNLYKNRPFAELTIGCESCHGPGALHVEERSKRLPVPGKVDTSIVNPAHLSPQLADDICISCHELGEARIPQAGKSFIDFRPGTPLLDTVAIFKSRLVMNWNMEEWYDEMKLSKCYRDSGARLSCVSCHDSHRSLTAAEAPVYYRAKCLGCHRQSSCTASLELRHGTTPSDNCVACHMPKHVAPSFVMLGTEGTSHRIVANEQEPLPTLETPGYSPDPATGLILVNGMPEAKAATLSPLVLLQAYESVIGRHPDRVDLLDRYNRLLDQLAATTSDNAIVLSALAKRELRQGSSEGNSAATDYLSRAIGRGSKSPQDFMLLAELLYRSGDRAQAVKILKEAISLFPYIPTPYENLAVCYFSMGDGANAKQVVTDGLTKFPGDSNLRTIDRRLQVTQ